MRLLHTAEGLRCCLAQGGTGSVGLVPTMGALHAGHLSLIDRARRETDRVVVSIFVNPLQFGPGEDLDRYPQTLEQDCDRCNAAGADIVFAPTPRSLYGTPHPAAADLTQVTPPAAMIAGLCGQSRPGHFQGVATVVTKLLNLVQPSRAYFGRKDAQQLAILKRLVQDLNLPVQIVDCPIVREADGLALSSRNRYLGPAERAQATILYQSLSAAETAFQAGVRLSSELVAIVKSGLATTPAAQPEYVALVHPDSLEPLEEIRTMGLLAIAARVGTTRLIDNICLRSRAPIIAIDGPAGAGKSTVARLVAHQLGLLYLDTGAMYRALTWYVLEQGTDPQDPVAVAELLPHCQIRLTAQVVQDDQPQPSEVWVNDRPVTQAIRSAEVTAQVSTVAAQAAVRQRLVQQQQQYGQQGGVVADGRDIGTQVFPQAELKIFLTASVAERAQRRQRDLQALEQPVPELEVLAETIRERDRKDSTRAISPLRQAKDAIEVSTDALTIEQVVDQITALYRQTVANRGGPS
ncbi:bifunctional pantoate--beta-alanine ligase/(d)CMP kinase [Romeria aff. gracilis LEGE 07310]|uniref:Bifunctional pantoate ligase/cytidylate kinase n=1 Tax=Vasconcelosia minhoensis LEGE 07310 TaxID=915328 RepID=A0A8J7DPI3_9CYAN|nr:bifunctional pantoate--beta-alanine ligase/(d)CMP kinase [Romeria gracilis]MBE9079745.1 bifunctional pantoate--beta-alanine ligase/(d)CMP kinase [Romeria aff. gracilis LEGE 07310]